MEDDRIVIVNDSLYSNAQLKQLISSDMHVSQVLKPQRSDKLRVAELIAIMQAEQYRSSVKQLRTSPTAALVPIQYIVVTDHPQDWSVLEECRDTLYCALTPPQLAQQPSSTMPIYSRVVLDESDSIAEHVIVIHKPLPSDYAKISRQLAGIACIVNLAPEDAVCVMLFEPDNLQAVETLVAFTQQLELEGRKLQFWKDYDRKKVENGSYLGALSLNTSKPPTVQILRRPAPPQPSIPEEKKRCRLKLYCTKTGAGSDCGYWHPPEELEQLRLYGSKKPRNVYLCGKHKGPNSSYEYPRCTYAHTEDEVFCTFCEGSGHHYSRCPEAGAA